LTRLNFETRHHHADASASWLALMEPSVTSIAYRDHLVRVYGFEGPVEAALAYTPYRMGLPELGTRSGYIVEDLMALAMRPAQIAHLPQCLVAPFASPEEGLGWLYVVERSTRLHNSVLIHVETHVPSLTSACAYLLATAGQTGARWREVNRALSTFDGHRAAQDRIVDAAEAAFRCSIAWYRAGQARAA
jgi:heme oxygenase